jgi:hypothetical protein
MSSRRSYVSWLAVLFAAMPIFAQQQAARASDFLNSVGVNTHFSYTDTPYYLQPSETIAAIQALGIHHVRDGLAYGWVPPHLYAVYAQLAQAGIHPDLVTPNPAHGGPSAQDLERLLPNYPGLDALEAPNEYDQAKNPNWAPDLRAYLPTLSQVGRDAGVPIIGPSLTQTESYPKLGDVAADETYSNLHAYWGGRNPETGGWGPPDAQGHIYGSFAYDFDQLNITGPGKPVFMTETGYVVTDVPKTNQISEAVEAIYEPRLLLHAWNLGVRRTYIYELMDDPSSPPGIGLMRSDRTPRPAYTALATLMRLLSDTPGPRPPGKLSFTLQGSASGLETTLLQKQDGSFWLAVWNPGCIYEVNRLQNTPIAPRMVTIAVGGGEVIRNAWTFDETGQAQQKSVQAATATLPIGSAVTLLEITTGPTGSTRVRHPANSTSSRAESAGHTKRVQSAG